MLVFSVYLQFSRIWIKVVCVLKIFRAQNSDLMNCKNQILRLVRMDVDNQPIVIFMLRCGSF